MFCSGRQCKKVYKFKLFKSFKWLILKYVPNCVYIKKSLENKTKKTKLLKNTIKLEVLYLFCFKV